MNKSLFLNMYVEVYIDIPAVLYVCTVHTCPVFNDK